MKKILVTLFLLITMSGYSQMWDTQRKTDLDKTFFVNTEVGYEFGIGDNHQNRISFDVTAIHNPESAFSFGIGTGIRYYEDETTLMPIFGEIRAYPFSYRRLFLPFASLKMGYSFNLSESFDPVGFMTTPSIGISYENYRNKFYNLSVGYAIQSIKNDRPPNDNSNGIALIFGITF